MWLAALILASGCAPAGPAPISPCAAWRPIYLDATDVISTETAAAILAHNETGARLCGWQPAGE